MKEVRWSAVQVGDLVLDRSNKEWIVNHIDTVDTVENLDHSIDITLKDSESKLVSGKVFPLQLVRRVYTVDELLKSHLGGEMIGIDDPKGYIVPETITMVPIMKSHLFMMHGVYARGLKSLAKLSYAHKQAHLEPKYTDYVPHRHDDKPFSNPVNHSLFPGE